MNDLCMFLPRVIAYAYDKISDDRSKKSFYFILKGQRSLQVLQDAQWFELEQFYATLPTLAYETYKKAYYESKQIKIMADVFHKEWFYTHLKNAETLQSASVFIAHVQLLVQVLSHWKANHKSYMPMIRSEKIQKFVKQILHKERNYCAMLCIHLYQEIYDLCMQMPENCCEIFMGRQMGFGYNARTFEQLSVHLKLDIYEVQMTWCALIQYMYLTVKKNPEKYSTLFRCIPIDEASRIFNRSVHQTKMLLKAGKTLEEICQIKKVKRTTVESHIVEIALQDMSFSLQPFISEEKLHMILQCAKQTRSYRLRTIKTYLGDSVSYFEIRLALTRRERGGNFEFKR